VIGMLGYCTEAEDIGQETFIRFYKALAKFRGDSSIGTYLTRIAINLSLNELKRRQRRRKRYHDNPEEKLEKVTTSSDSYEREDKKEMVRQAVQKLDPKSRAVIVLRLIDGYSTQETANILKLPTGTVLSRLARGQMKLRDILTPLYEG
jgi:RNA polymerase sigma-70 factor (ECF subfamily)